MRMWCVPTKLLCRNHLLGEHLEAHMIAAHILKGYKLGKFLTNRLINPAQIEQRHEDLAAELLIRGYKHNSPLQDLTTVRDKLIENSLDIEENIRELSRRCSKCRERITNGTTRNIM